MRQRLEYALAWPFITTLSLLPRSLARATAISLSWLVYLLHVRLRHVGMRNLAMALPEKSRHEHARILRGNLPRWAANSLKSASFLGTQRKCQPRGDL